MGKFWGDYKKVVGKKWRAVSKATGNSRFERQKFPPLSVKIPENSRYENTAYMYPVFKANRHLFQ